MQPRTDTVCYAFVGGNSKRKILTALGEKNRHFHTLLGGMWIDKSFWGEVLAITDMSLKKISTDPFPRHVHFQKSVLRKP